MSIFDKPISGLTAQDLDELLQENATENSRLEFKRDCPDKDEMLKKLSSFANTFGGYVVVGAEADSKDGRIRGLPGVDPQRNYKQQLVQWCFGSVSPPLPPEVSDPIPVPDFPGKVCYVIYIAESEWAPHFLNGRKGVWVRTDEFSSKFEARLAVANELQQMFQRRERAVARRQGLAERARRRFDAYIKELSKSNADYSVLLSPEFPSRPVCTEAKLSKLSQEIRVPWRGTTFPVGVSEVLTQHESVLSLQPSGKDCRSLLELSCWGSVFYATEASFEFYPNAAGIHLNQFLGQMLVLCRYAAAVHRHSGPIGRIRIEVQLRGMRGTQSIRFRHNSPLSRGRIGPRRRNQPPH